MTDVKIRCDDCKFVEDCVDYGWEGCKKFTPTPSEPMTNEEYLKSLNTEQLAEFIADVCYELVDDICANYDDTSCDYRQTEKNYWTKWLKQPHHNEVEK